MRNTQLCNSDVEPKNNSTNALNPSGRLSNEWINDVDGPVRFRRTSSMEALPVPVRGGTLEELDCFLNVSNEHKKLIKIFIFGALRGHSEYPQEGEYWILALQGEGGTAKSFIARSLKAIIDPEHVPVVSLITREDHFWTAARNRFLLAFDNVHSIDKRLSARLSQLATGSGEIRRTHNTMHDETNVGFCRPTILNGIDNFLEGREDLTQRTLLVNTIYIDKHHDQREFRAEFRQRLPFILGALFDAVSNGIRNLPQTTTLRHRFASMARWVAACWSEGSVQEALNANAEASLIRQIKTFPVLEALDAFMSSRREWAGEGTKFLAHLRAQYGEENATAAARRQGPHGWPGAAKVLSQWLHDDRYLTPLVRRMGYGFHTKHTGRNRIWTVVNSRYREQEPVNMGALDTSLASTISKSAAKAKSKRRRITARRARAGVVKCKVKSRSAKASRRAKIKQR